MSIVHTGGGTARCAGSGSDAIEKQPRHADRLGVELRMGLLLGGKPVALVREGGDESLAHIPNGRHRESSD